MDDLRVLNRAVSVFLEVLDYFGYSVVRNSGEIQNAGGYVWLAQGDWQSRRENSTALVGYRLGAPDQLRAIVYTANACGLMVRGHQARRSRGVLHLGLLGAIQTDAHLDQALAEFFDALWDVLPTSSEIQRLKSLELRLGRGRRTIDVQSD